MEAFNEEKFKELASKTGELVISIYTPTSKKSTDSYQTDKTDFKNKLKAVGNELGQIHHLEEEQIKRLLQPGQALLDNLEFWKYNSDMLAYFIIDGEVEMYRVPIKMEEGIYFIGKRPYLLPMIPELNNDGNFYLLLVDLDRIRLYQGSRNEFREIELDPEEMPVSFSEEEAMDEFQGVHKKQGGVGGGGERFTGHEEGPGEERKRLILDYLNRLCNTLEPKLHENPLPLYLAGSDHYVSLFQQACKYNLLKKGTIGNIKGSNKKELHEKAWKVAEVEFTKESETRKEQFGFKASRNLAIFNDKPKLIKAAITGGVDTLWVNKSHQKHLWGTYNDENFTVEFDEGPTGKNHCLIDLSAVKVIENGGKAYLVPPEEMPTEELIAGTLRYEV